MQVRNKEDTKGKREMTIVTLVSQATGVSRVEVKEALWTSGGQMGARGDGDGILKLAEKEREEEPAPPWVRFSFPMTCYSWEQALQ